MTLTKAVSLAILLLAAFAAGSFFTRARLTEQHERELQELRLQEEQRIDALREKWLKLQEKKIQQVVQNMEEARQVREDAANHRKRNHGGIN